MKLRYPDYITIFTEKEKFTFSNTQQCKAKDISLTADTVNNALNIKLLADTSAVTYIRVRWSFTEDEKRKHKDTWRRLGAHLRQLRMERCLRSALYALGVCSVQRLRCQS